MTTPITEWQNRIVGYDPAVPLDQLLAHPQNPKIHPTEQTEAVKAVIARLGWLDTVKVNVRTQHVLDGHDRIKAAMQAGQTTAPVDYVDVPEEDEFLVLGSYDFVGALAVTDTDLYGEGLAALQAEDAALLESLLRGDDRAAILPEPAIVPGGGGDEFDATPVAGPTRCAVGDVWRIGAHRLAVGDSTDAATVGQLMGTAKAGMVWADPVYNTGKQQGRTAKDWGMVANDALTPEQYLDLLRAFASITAIVGATEVYICCDYRSYPDVVQVFDRPRSCIVWAKNNFGLGSGYRRQHEFIAYWGAFAGTTESDLWEIAKDAGTEYTHPMQKPVALITRAIRNSTQPGAVVFDPFGGSGPSVVAAHREQRICRVIELEPKWADVILRRAEAEGIGPIERLTAT